MEVSESRPQLALVRSHEDDERDGWLLEGSGDDLRKKIAIK